MPMLTAKEVRISWTRVLGEQRTKRNGNRSLKLDLTKGKKMKPIFASKSDLKSAFHVLGLSRSSWKWLVMKAQDLKTGSWMFFIDKCLPFGSSISCAHFQHFSNALHHLIEHRLQMKRRVTNYLDNFCLLQEP